MKEKMRTILHDIESSSVLHLDVQISSVKYVSDYTLYVRFVDGTEGNVALDDLVGKGVFARLTDPGLFSKVFATDHSIAWSDDLEIDSNRIYLELTGQAHASNQ